MGRRLFGLTAGACNDLTRPVSEPTEEDPRATGPGILLPVAYQETPVAHCLDNPATVIHQVDGITYCVVGMEDMITARVEGGAGVPPPPPELPTIGVDPPVNYWDWPTEPGGGGIEPGPGEGCDPEAFLNPCAEFDAFLGCPVDGVERGATGRCFLRVEPDTALEGINQWRFNGEHIDVFSTHQDTIWEGTLVESGLVTVFFQAYDRESSETTLLAVEDREGNAWAWSDGNGISYDEGGLPNPPSWPETRIAIICHPTQGCGGPTGPTQDEYFVQPQNPVHGDGLTSCPLGSTATSP